MSGCERVTFHLERDQAAELFRLVDLNPELLPPDMRVPLRSELAAAVKLEGAAACKCKAESARLALAYTAIAFLDSLAESPTLSDAAFRVAVLLMRYADKAGRVLAVAETPRV